MEKVTVVQIWGTVVGTSDSVAGTGGIVKGTICSLNVSFFSMSIPVIIICANNMLLHFQ